MYNDSLQQRLYPHKTEEKVIYDVLMKIIYSLFKK